MTPTRHHEHGPSAADEPSVLARLRTLVPKRPLTPSESYRIAELQANRLLHHFDVRATAVSEEIVSELPRVRVIREQGLAVSAAAYWNGRHWIIALNADEPRVRQRFSLMHEFKHVLDHTTKEWLYRDRPGSSAEAQAERVADHFAASVLMPKRVVRGLWCSGEQDIPTLARSLDVSTRALRVRLDQLGMTEPVERCVGRPTRQMYRRFAHPTGRPSSTAEFLKTRETV